jgi:hypothetical protein
VPDGSPPPPPPHSPYSSSSPSGWPSCCAFALTPAGAARRRGSGSRTARTKMNTSPYPTRSIRRASNPLSESEVILNTHMNCHLNLNLPVKSICGSSSSSLFSVMFVTRLEMNFEFRISNL